MKSQIHYNKANPEIKDIEWEILDPNNQIIIQSKKAKIKLKFKKQQ
jgi:hypothetical protein